MKILFYLDTCIWRDYFEDRKDGIQPLGEFAFQFLKNCEKKEYKILVSDVVIEELKSHYTQEKINEVFSSFEKFLMKISVSNEQIKEAQKISEKNNETHFNDALHAVLSRDNKATMITRDKHFETLRAIVEVEKPENAIL